MKASEVYRVAAELVFSRKACSTPDCGYPCCGVASALPVDTDALNYRDLTQGFIGYFDCNFTSSVMRRDQIDISMMLLLMSEIAKDEERKSGHAL